MKKISLLLLSILLFTSCAELENFANNTSQQADKTSNSQSLSQGEISGGLKEALHKGVDLQVSKLMKENGYYKNDLVKIGLPKELQQVESGLRKLGLGNLADEGIKAMNRAAEDAVGRATPIFINAIKEMSFKDAQNILIGDNTAATTYLKDRTNDKLFEEFHPEISKSFSKVGADKIWNNLIKKYNNLPLTEKVNPDLTEYVTQQALEGVYKMVGKEEENIRKNVSARTSNLLERVFAKQDKI